MKTTPWMPLVGIHLPIYHLRPFRDKPRCLPCVPVFPPSLSFSNFSEKSSVQPVPTNAIHSLEFEFIARSRHHPSSTRRFLLPGDSSCQGLLPGHGGAPGFCCVAVVPPATVTTPSSSSDIKDSALVLPSSFLFKPYMSWCPLSLDS
jgi:hypothetical protein